MQLLLYDECERDVSENVGGGGGGAQLEGVRDERENSNIKKQLKNRLLGVWLTLLSATTKGVFLERSRFSDSI